jgi:hypothetical protein
MTDTPTTDSVAISPREATLPSGPGEAPPHATSPGPPPDPILALIERASRDPDVDIQKFERLWAMRRERQAELASIAFAEAFAELQPELPIIDRNGSIVVYSKTDRERVGGVPEGAKPIQQTPYAQLDDILEAIRAPLHKHGFSIRFEYASTAENKLVTTAILRHRAGHEERAATPALQHDSTGSKNPTQAVGSALTYGRRYALMAVLPIVSHAPQDADDDGDATSKAPIDADQVAYIETQVRDTESNMPKFLANIGAPSVADMTIAQYKRAVALLNEKKRRAKAAKP